METEAKTVIIATKFFLVHVVIVPVPPEDDGFARPMGRARNIEDGNLPKPCASRIGRKTRNLFLGLVTALLLGGCGGPLISDPEAVPDVLPGMGVRAENRTTFPRGKPLEQGDDVPAFVWADQSGRDVSTAELVTAGDALLVFLPPGDTPARRPVYDWVRTHRDRLAARGCELLLVSPDPVDSNAAVASAEDLRVAVLADPSSWSARAFGVLFDPDDRALDRPWSVLIGREGRILEVRAGLFDSTDYITALTVRRGGQEEKRVLDFLWE